MDRSRITTLYVLSRLAYQAEHEKSREEALRLHQQAMQAWLEFETTGTFFSTEEREYKRRATKKAEFHNERFAVLMRAQANASGAVVPLPPSLVTLSRELEVPTEMLPLSMVERQFPQTVLDNVDSFTNSLNASLPQETYRVYQSSTWKQAFCRWFLYAVRDSTDTQTLYLLEACHRHGCQISSTNFYRVADYPQPAIVTTVTPVAPKKSSYEVGTGFKGRPLTLASNVLPKPICEQPDRIERQPWGPRRFVYGGRRFVWKMAEKKDDGFRPENLYEYTRTKPMVGSKTGKMDDDANPKCLFWSDKLPWAQRRMKRVVHCVGGLDQGFKEHLLASQLTKMVVHGTALW